MLSAPDLRTPSLAPLNAAPLAPAPFLPMSRAEMLALGWEQCDVIIVTGDAYVDHPSFGMAVIGRVLEALGLRVGIIAQPDWHSADALRALGPPRLFFGITAGNMDSTRCNTSSGKPLARRLARLMCGHPCKEPEPRQWRTISSICLAL